MNKAEAKALSIEMWQYLVVNTSCRSKEETPYWEELKNLKHNCPLCATTECKACPIAINSDCKLYTWWLKGEVQTSHWAAVEILERIREWII